MDNIAQKFGFDFFTTSYASKGVQMYHLKFLKENGYPLDTPSDAEYWVGVQKDGRVYCVFGLRNLPKAIEVTDFYIYNSGLKEHENRWGKLAGYAAIQKIKRDSDILQIPIVTATPAKNTHMIEAYKKIFGVEEPVLHVYRYEPKKIEEAA
jgi:hypothetical protein